jgi:uncharacterized lipoprotein YmbA
MIHPKLLLNLLIVLATVAGAGCLRPKRANDIAHVYVLSPAAVRPNEPSPALRDLRLGIAPVEMPPYLLDRRMILRKGTNEVIYLENHRWAERVDQEVQRVVAADLGTLLDTDRIVLSSWLRQSVQVEVHLAVQRLDCDDHGEVHLDARWRIATPGGEKTLFTGRSQITRQSMPGVRNTDLAVSQMSEVLAEMSGQIAAALPGALDLRTPK